jgi:hypothetical protein
MRRENLPQSLGFLVLAFLVPAQIPRLPLEAEPISFHRQKGYNSRESMP